MPETSQDRADAGSGHKQRTLKRVRHVTTSEQRPAAESAAAAAAASCPITNTDRQGERSGLKVRFTEAMRGNVLYTVHIATRARRQLLIALCVCVFVSSADNTSSRPGKKRQFGIGVALRRKFALTEAKRSRSSQTDGINAMEFRLIAPPPPFNFTQIDFIVYAIQYENFSVRSTSDMTL